MGEKTDEFREERERLNEEVLDFGGKRIGRFFNLDTNVYREGELAKETKELLGLVASLVLRCDDCVNYHLVECKKAGIRDRELEEALSIGLVVGGSITIPHLRHAVDFWRELDEENVKE